MTAAGRQAPVPLRTSPEQAFPAPASSEIVRILARNVSQLLLLTSIVHSRTKTEKEATGLKSPFSAPVVSFLSKKCFKIKH